MPNLHLRTFTDRSEAIALFRSFLGRDPSKPWPLLPILAFIAPGGSGKSTLIEYLRVTACCLPDPQESAALPYAHLDFTLAGAPTDLLSILIALRNQLQWHHDGQGRHLTFPRFDLAAAIAAATPPDGTLPLLDQKELRQRLAAGLPLIGPLGEMGNALAGYFPLIPPLLVGLQWMSKLPPLQTLLQRLEQGPGWRWYQTQSIEVGLLPQASITEVLLRLHELSIPGKPGREVLVERLLPAAFLADLRDALDGPHEALAWSKAVTVVLFLDGFDALLEGKGSTGIRLLEVLACAAHRTQGQTDPLLVVLGSRQRLLELTDVAQHPPFEDMTRVVDDALVRDQVHARYTSWQHHVPGPGKRHYLRLRDLLLPLWLQDFGIEHTREYLARVGEQEHTAVLTHEPLVQAIHHATLGHPLYTALAAAAVLEAEAHGQPLSLAELTNAPVPPEVVRGHQDEAIGAYLLGLFLRQLSAEEQQEVIFCAVPRTLDVAAVQVVLQGSSEEAQQRWTHFRRYTFVRLLDEQRLVLHPIVRALLLQQLPAPPAQLLAESDYSYLHQRLRDHFHRLTEVQETARQRTAQWQVQLEETYHALALGDPAPAIRLGIAAQREVLLLWQPLLDAVAQAPTGLIPQDAERQAYSALLQAEQQRDVQDGVTAIVLYTWLLTAARGNAAQGAALLHNLGTAYQSLPGGDRQANLQQAIACFTQALQVYTREAFPERWAGTQNNLGNVYSQLPGGDRQANLQQAIRCYTQALQVFKSLHVDSSARVVQRNLDGVRDALQGPHRDQ
jgi:tetratricopeptide (TPR) repeat protein